MLSDVHDGAARVLASKNGDRFAGIDTETRDGGALFVSGTSVRMDVTVTECEVELIVFHRRAFRRPTAS